ncbi:MAG: phage/plasmid primase, P4 family [Planctomycetota bacterium]
MKKRKRLDSTTDKHLASAGSAEDRPEGPSLSKKAPLDSAREFVRRNYTSGDDRLLHSIRGELLKWSGCGYVETSTEAMKSELYRFLDGATEGGTDHGFRPFKPTQRDVANVIDALKAECFIDLAPPTWIEEPDEPPADRLIVGRNGWIDPLASTLVIHAPTPRLLTTSPLDFEIDVEAQEPLTWLTFLESLQLQDDALRLLQEFFGYALTSDTSQQKALMIIGPKRSGKGTILRVLTRLVGPYNTCSPTLGSLAGNFGLSPLLDKRLATIGDARLSGRTDQAIVTERLLSVIGEDGVTVDRKHREPVTGKLGVRFAIATNELPRLSDASGALSGRMLMLPLREQFYGREDVSLSERLIADLPGILMWALDGLRRLRDRGKFVQPASGCEMQQEMDDLGSPVSAFVRERCDVESGLSVECDTLFEAWRIWCRGQGRENAGTKANFGRELRPVVPGLKRTQPRTDVGRLGHYEGIDLKISSEVP